MPKRADAKPPGVFIRDHLVAVGGTDYVQSIYKAYRNHLAGLKIQSKASRASFSNYIWVAHQLGLINFDHAESQERWGAEEDGGVVEKGYVPEPRPQAPSPRHYYRIVDAQDPRWLDMNSAYRSMVGLPEKPTSRPRKPREKKAPVTTPAPKTPKTRQPRKKKPQTNDIEAYIKKIRALSRRLFEFTKTPSTKLLDPIERELVALNAEIVEKYDTAEGRRREQLSDLTYNISHALEKMPVIRTPLATMEKEKAPDRKSKAKRSVASGVKVVREELEIGLDQILK